MIESIYSFLEIIGVVLQVLLVVFLFSSFRRYPILFAYSVVYLATTALESTVAHTIGRNRAIYSTVYWTDEVLLDLLLFLVVISLVYQAARDNPMAAIFQKMLMAVVAAAVILPFVLLNPPYFKSHWFNGTSQMLNFGATLMNLALWTVLIGLRRKDPQLLLVSVGVGVAVTGASISYGLRQFLSPDLFWVPNLFLILTHVAGVGVWSWAFRPGTKTRPAENTNAGALSGA
jgi:hypothetical protein